MEIKNPSVARMRQTNFLVSAIFPLYLCSIFQKYKSFILLQMVKGEYKVGHFSHVSMFLFLIQKYIISTGLHIAFPSVRTFREKNHTNDYINSKPKHYLEPLLSNFIILKLQEVLKIARTPPADHN